MTSTQSQTGIDGPDRLVVVHIPHASIVIPQDLWDTFIVGGRELEDERLRMTDWYTDEVYGDLVAADATICFPVSRLVVDPERFLDDEQEPMAGERDGRGLPAHIRWAPLARPDHAR